ncbi:hypothetical protein J6590_103933, partial [Homalodisca vitripennis]
MELKGTEVQELIHPEKDLLINSVPTEDSQAVSQCSPRPRYSKTSLPQEIRHPATVTHTPLLPCFPCCHKANTRRYQTCSETKRVKSQTSAKTG